MNSIAGERAHRDVDVGFAHVAESGGQDADDGERPSVEDEALLSDGFRISAELLPPEGVADQRHRFRADAVVSIDEAASRGRANAEHVEEVRGHPPAVYSPRLIAAGQRKEARPPRGQSVERT